MDFFFPENDELMVLRRFSVFVFVLFTISTYANQVDSLLHVLDERKEWNDPDQLYEINFDLGEAYGPRGTEAYDKSAYYYTEAYNIAKAQNHSKRMAESLFSIGVCHQRRNNYQEALEYYYAVFELENQNNENHQKAGAYSQVSTIYQVLGDYQKAFENQMQALLINEMDNDSIGIANSYYNLGSIFYYQNQYHKALEHYEQAKVICDAIKSSRSIYACMAALGAVHEKLGNDKKSLEFNQNSLALAKKLNYKTGISYALGNIAVNLLAQKEYQEAERMLKEAILLKEDLGDKFGLIGNSIDLAKVYQKSERPTDAILTLTEALQIAKAVDSKTRQADIYKNLALAYDQLNDPIRELSYIKEYMALKDMLLNEKTVEEMGQSKRRYEVEKQEHQITILKKENEILGKNEEIRKQQVYIFASAIVAFIMFIWWYKNKLKHQHEVNNLLEEKNELLNEKNELLNEKNEEIFIKNKQLKYSNENLQQFAYVASHDLKEPLRMINSYTKLIERRYHQHFDDSGREFMHYVIDAVKRMETLLDDLLDFSRAGIQSAPTKFLYVNDVMLMVEANLRHRLQTLNVTLIVKKENLPEMKAHRTQLIQLLQNLVSNGMKFKGERDPVVVVDGEQKDNNYIISVKDNGIGISKDNLEKVFEMFRRLHSRDEYEGTGIGLATCKRIVDSWGGDIWVESVEGEGSTFFFSVPGSYARMQTKENITSAAI